jgi:hypothetical protein
MVEEFRFVVAVHRFDASSHHLAHFLVSGFDLVHGNIQRRAAGHRAPVHLVEHRFEPYPESLEFWL